MSDRLQLIRDAVEKDGRNIEDAYADRAWLLSEYDHLLTENSRYETALRSIYNRDTVGESQLETIQALSRIALDAVSSRECQKDG